MKKCNDEKGLFSLVSGLLEARSDYADLLGGMEPDFILGEKVDKVRLLSKLDGIEATMTSQRKAIHSKTIGDWKTDLKERIELPLVELE